jgi:hypothetical protein
MDEILADYNELAPARLDRFLNTPLPRQSGAFAPAAAHAPQAAMLLPRRRAA